MHTDAQQTARLHAIPAFAEAMRVRGLEVGDRVLHTDREVYPEPCLVVMVVEDTCKMVDSATCHLNVDLADCHLMPSESDLWDYLQTVDCEDVYMVVHGTDAYVYHEKNGTVYHEGESDTRIGALVAAVVAVGGE